MNPLSGRIRTNVPLNIPQEKKEPSRVSNVISSINSLVQDAESAQQRSGIKAAKDTACQKLKECNKTLEEALNNNKDINDRLSDIISNKLAYKGHRDRQLLDIAYCLSLLSLKGNEGKKLTQLLEKVNEISPFLSTEGVVWGSELDKIESLIRISIARPDELPETRSRLLDKRSVDIDEKSAAFIHAENVIKGSKYEGHSSVGLITMLKGYLEANKAHYSNIPKLNSIMKMLKDAESLSSATKDSNIPLEALKLHIEGMKQRLDSFSGQIGKIIGQLQPGEKTMLNIGWVGIPSGHSMKLTIEKEKGGTLLLRVFNAGAGVENHVWLHDRGELLVEPFIEISGVEVKRFLDRDYLQALIEFKGLRMNPAHPDRRLNTEYSAKDIYAFFLKSLGGNILPSSGDREKFIPPQVAGTCTWSSLMAVLRTELPLKDYYRIATDITMDSLAAQYQRYQNNLAGNEEAKILLQHGLTNMAQLACDAFENKAITPVQLLTIHTSLKELKTALDKAESETQAAALFNREVVFENYEPLKVRGTTEAILPTLQKIEPHDYISDNLKKSQVMPFSFEWMDHPYSLTGGLNYLTKYVQSCIDSGNALEGIYQLERFFALQAIEGKSALWNEIPEKDISKAIILFADLSEMLCGAQSKYPERLKSYTLYAYYLAANSVQLSSKLPALDVDGRKMNSQGLAEGFRLWCGLSSVNTQAPIKDTTLFAPEDRILRKAILDILPPFAEEKEYKMPFSESIVGYDRPQALPEIPLTESFQDYELGFIDAFLKEHPFPDEKLSRTEALGKAYSDWYGKVLPADFCALRRQILIASAFKLEKPLKPVRGDLITTSHISSAKTNLIKLESAVNKKEKEKPKEPNENEIFKLRREEIKAKTFSEADIMAKSYDEWERNLRLILTQGDTDQTDRHFEQQLIKAIAFFSDHFTNLADRDKQLMLHQLIFESDYLESILEGNPYFGKEILEFAKRGQEIFLERGDIAAVAFFIELSRDVDAILCMQGLKSEAIDIRAQIFSLLGIEDNDLNDWKPPKNLTINQLSHLYAQAAASYESHPPVHFDEKDAVLLSIALMHNNFYPLPQNFKSAHLDNQMQRAAHRCAPELQKILQSEWGSAISATVLRTFIPHAGTSKFDTLKNYPLVSSLDQKFSLNMQTFEIFENNKALTGLPQAVLNDPTFRKFFKKEKYACYKISSNCYEFMDERNRKIQVLTIPGGASAFAIRQEALGYWYEMADASALHIRSGELPEDFANLIKEEKIWVPLVKEDKPIVLVCNHDLKITHFLNLKAAPEQNQKLYSINQLMGIRKVKKEDYPLHLVDLKEIKNHALELLLKNAMLWADKDGKLKELDIPSMQLSFTFSTPNKGCQADCQEYPGFFVSPNQSYRGLQYIEKGIVLENEKGKRKLVLPYGTVTPAGKTLTLNTGLNISGENSIVFDLDKNSRPITKDREQKLYLANLCFVQKKYQKAQNLIRDSKTLLKPLSVQEEKLLWQIIINQEQDASPHALALALTALSQVSKNDISEELSLQIKRLKKECVKASGQQLSIPHLELTDEERQSLLKYIPVLALPASNIEKLIYPSVKTSRQARPFTIDQVFISKSRLDEDQKKIDQVLITRHVEPQVMRWLEYALKDPLKLELMLIGARHNPNIPNELILLLESVSHGFEIDMQRFKRIQLSKDSKAFLTLVKEAENFEWMWQSKQQAVDKKGTLLGTRAKRAERKAEKQDMGLKSEKQLPYFLVPLQERPPLLSPEVLKNLFIEVPNKGLQLSQEDIKGLKNAVLADVKGMPTPESKKLAEHIETYWTHDAQKKEYHYLKPETLNKTATLLHIQAAELAKQINLQEQELFAFANALPVDIKDAVLFATEKMGQIRQEVSLKELILFTARWRHFTLKGKNPSLESKEGELLKRVLRFLDLTAVAQQTERCIAIIEKLPMDTKSRAYAQLSEALYQEITRKPKYKAHQHPELLVFETQEQIGLHDSQVTDLERMLAPKEGENPNVILEKVMGSGKTKVYLPLLALSKADGDSISFIVVHSSQYEEVGQAMQIKGEELFAQVAHPFNFSRESDTSLPALKALLLECEKVRSQKHFFVARDKSIHSLGLAFDEMWHEYLQSNVDDPVQEARIDVMREIVNLIRTKGKATLDEADLLLNCRYEVVYALGDALSLSKEHSQVVSALYKSISPLLSILQPFTEEGYKEIKPSLISSYVREVVLKKYPNYDMLKIISYLKGEQAGADYVTKLSEKERNLLSIAFYEFKELLPLVLEKRSGEHYGYSDNIKKVLPVPYLASGIPSPTSEFSFPYAQLNYTMQTLLHVGVTPHLLKGVINDMQLRAEKERKMDRLLSLKETAAFKDFEELCGDVSGIPFLNYNETDIEKLVLSFKQNPEKIYPFAEKILFPFVTMHKFKLTSTPYAMTNMFAEVQGFTGTPYNSAAYPVRLETLRDPNTSGKTQGIIWKNSQTVLSLKSSSFNEIMKEIGTRLERGDYGAFIDVGAIFNGINNQEVAEKFLASLPKESFKGVLFYKNNHPYVLERGKDPIPYGKYDSTQGLFIFYDQYHTTGTDYVINGKSLLSFGKNSSMRDLEQGYMRDRQSAAEERVEFILSPETQGYCRIAMNLDKNARINTAMILSVAQINQDQEVRTQKLMGTFGRLNEAIHLELRILLSDRDIPPKELKKFAKEIDALIVDTVKDAPWEQLGMHQNEQFAKDFFDTLISQMSAKIEPLFKGFYENPEVAKTHLMTALKRCVKLNDLPAKITSSAKSGPEQQSLTLVEQEQASLVQKEQLSDLGKEKPSSALHWFWQRTSAAETSYYRTMNPRNLGTDFIKNPTEHFLKNQAPFFSVNDLLELEPELKEFRDLFDIEASYNFHPFLGKSRTSNTIVSKKLFEKGQLDVQNMLLCTNKKTGKKQLRLISGADEGFFFKNLPMKYADDIDIDPVMEVTLYNLSLGVLQSNNKLIQSGRKDPIDETYGRKIVQAKFFNGESFYTPAELSDLQKWIKDKGFIRMKDLFVNHIIKHNKAKTDAFRGSPLSKLFTEMR